MKKNAYHIFFLLLVVLFSSVIFKLIEVNGFAQTTNFSFELTQTDITESEEVSLNISIDKNIQAGDEIIICYPDGFQINNLEEVKQDKANSVTDAFNNEEEHSVKLVMNENSKKNNFKLKGKFSKSGKYSFTATYDNETIIKEIFVEDKKASETSDSSADEVESTENKVQSENPSLTNSSTNNSVKEEIDSSKESSLESRAAIPDFDWNLLNNDGLDLSTFTKVDVNTPVKLTGGLFDKQQRNYYLFLGHTDGTYNYDTKEFSQSGNLLGSFSHTDTAGRPILGPAILGVKKRVGNEKKAKVVDHSYFSEESTIFDVGEMSEEIGPVELSRNTTRDGLMISEYIKNNELVAYGFLGRAKASKATQTVDYQPVRIHGYALDQTSGRIRYDVSYYNPQNTEKYYAMTYGLHVDIGGAHTDSKLFANNSDGIYFDEESVPADKIGEKLFFHMSGYKGANGPTAYKVGTYKSVSFIGSWLTLKTMNNSWLYNPVGGSKTPYDVWDPFEPAGYKYPTGHPIFVYRWDPVRVPAGGVGMGSFDISLEEKADVMPEAEKKYVNMTSSDEKNYVGDTLNFTLIAGNNTSAKTDWKSVSIQDVLSEGLEVDSKSFKLVNLEGTEVPLQSNVYNAETRTLKVGVGDIPPGENFKVKFDATISGKSGETIVNKMKAFNQDDTLTRESEVSIPVEKKPISYDLKEEVLHEDGTKAETAQKGETLTYRATLKNPFKAGKEPKPTYKTLQIVTNTLDSNLENFTDLALKNQSGENIGRAIYNSGINMIYGLFNDKDGTSLAANQDIYLEYKATVKKEITTGTTIIGQSNSNATLNDGSALPYITSNKVETVVKEGALVFVSAPKVLDFGTDLKIASKDKKYPIQTTDSPLVVQDFRTKGNHWRMMATLTKELTSPMNHHLSDSIHYKTKDRDVSLLLGVSHPIYEKETQDESAVTISNEWSGTKNGPILEVGAGKATAESYTGTIQWTLQDVPVNQD